MKIIKDSFWRSPWRVVGVLVAAVVICLFLFGWSVRSCSRDIEAIRQAQHEKCLNMCRDAGHTPFDCEYTLCK
jgi:hypothetical protein